jgi:hypothetical protein
MRDETIAVHAAYAPDTTRLPMTAAEKIDQRALLSSARLSGAGLLGSE